MDRFEQTELAQSLIVRLNDLEMLFMDLQRTVESLDEVVRQQHRRLDTLEQAVVRLAGHMDHTADEPDQVRATLDERPPHY